MESEDVIDLMDEEEEEVEELGGAMATSPPPSRDPMAGIGYWESPGNSPKPARKCKVEEEHVDDTDGDFAHQRSRDKIIVDYHSKKM